MQDKDKLNIRIPKKKQQINDSVKYEKEIRHYDYNIREHDNSSFSNLLSQIDVNKDKNDSNNK